MRIITWNCQGAFRRKADIILAHKPDILLVQECEQLNDLSFNTSNRPIKFYHWHGDNKHKGIAIYSFSDYNIELLSDFNADFRYILPFRVKGGGQSFTLFAIWAMNNKINREARYIGQVWLSLNHYADLLECPSILIGDFNSNKIWDYKGRVGNHSDVVLKLADHDIHSVYHQHFDMPQGTEAHPTFFLQRNQNKPYHIDYYFASKVLLDKVIKVDVGTYDDWIPYSDHVPMIVDFNL
jgi:exodeoxyribonuclease III